MPDTLPWAAIERIGPALDAPNLLVSQTLIVAASPEESARAPPPAVDTNAEEEEADEDEDEDKDEEDEEDEDNDENASVSFLFFSLFFPCFFFR